MPYNSSAFEKQLARHKAAQAGKAAAEATPHDPHRIRPRASAERGTLQPNTVSASQLVGDGPQSTPVLRGDQQKDVQAAGQTVIIINGRKKPIWLRGWFIFLMTTVLSTAAMPVFFKDEMHEMMGLLETVKTTTGVDPLSIKTYTNMTRGRAPEQAQEPAPVAETPSMDINTVVDQAQQQAEEVTSRGAGHSMEYIEQETKRLNDMARELDRQYNGGGR